MSVESQGSVVEMPKVEAQSLGQLFLSANRSLDVWTDDETMMTGTPFDRHHLKKVLKPGSSTMSRGLSERGRAQEAKNDIHLQFDFVPGLNLGPD